MFDSTTVQSTRTFLPFSIPASSATLTSSRLICSSVSNFTALMFAARVDFDGVGSMMPSWQNVR